MEGGRDRGVDDLEVTAASELLELDEGEIGLDAGGVAIHDQADGAGRGDAGDLGVAEAVLLAQLDHAIRFTAGGLDEVARTVAVVDAHGGNSEGFVFLAWGVPGGPAVVADD